MTTIPEIIINISCKFYAKSSCQAPTSLKYLASIFFVDCHEMDQEAMVCDATSNLGAR